LELQAVRPEIKYKKYLGRLVVLYVIMKERVDDIVEWPRWCIWCSSRIPSHLEKLSSVASAYVSDFS